MFTQIKMTLVFTLTAALGLALLGALTSQHASAQPRGPAAEVVFVNRAAGGANNGTSWDNAYTDLQSALAAAAGGDEIWVAAGVYTPTGVVGQREATFQLQDDVALYGGFAGTETTRSERDWAVRLTILSGDIDGNDPNNDGNHIAERASELAGENSYHVVTGSGVTTTAVLDGFIITAGNAAAVDYPHHRGGGLLNDGGSPTLANLRISGNNASLTGGGMYNITSSAHLTNIIFSGNTATYGGGLFNVNGTPSLTNVTFQGNSAVEEGGGMSNDNGAPPLTNVVFQGNQTKLGAGLYNANGTPVLTNVTMSGNRATTGGGIYNRNSSLTLQNSIVWNNLASQNGSALFNDSASVTIRYSLVQGCNPGSVWNGACGFDDGQNLADADPLFVTAPNPAGAPTTAGDLRLQTTSPAIDRGDTNAVPAAVTTDLDGQARVVNGAVDLGAFEQASASTQRVFLPLAVTS
jgi:hypothetical protein